MKITIRKTNEGSGVRWVLDYTPANGKRVRRFFKTQEEAKAAATEQDQMSRRAGEDWLALSTVQRLDLLSGYERIRSRGLTLNAVLDQWEAGQGASNGNGQLVPISLSKAGDGWLAHLARKGSSKAHIATCGSWVRRFARGREQQQVQAITSKDILEWLANFDGVTYNNQRDAARNFFGWCFDNKHHKELICTSKIAPVKKIPHKIPSHLTVEQTRTLMRFCMANPEYLGYVTLALWCGIRPSECDRMAWADIDFEHGIVNVRVTKTGEPRQIHMTETTAAWMRLAKQHNSPIGPDFAPTVSIKADKIRALREALGMAEWPMDILRHSFGSYYCELSRSIGDTAIEMGNTEAIIKKHYRAVIRPDQCREFWAITPESISTAPQTVNP